MSRKLPSQPTVNIGLVGHVDHGKTTLTKALSGIWTDTHSEERKRGISIKLGYADTAFYKTKDGVFYPSGRHPEGEKDSKEDLQRVVSFVDAPGHETLMAIMITGASIMDGALLMVAANETCPQPQTREHLMALNISGIKNIIVVQNKIDLVSKERAIESYNEIKEFLKDTVAENSPVIPVSAHHDVNLDVLIEAIESTIPTPDRSSDTRSVMHVARSFDINRPGTRPAKMRGGVIGGSIVEGEFKIGDEIEIGPGRKIEKGSKTHWEPISATVSSMQVDCVEWLPNSTLQLQIQIIYLVK
jgi:translation initiation factor 2 subunit 3